jgi:hypothetical protein
MVVALLIAVAAGAAAFLLAGALVLVCHGTVAK